MLFGVPSSACHDSFECPLSIRSNHLFRLSGCHSVLVMDSRDLDRRQGFLLRRLHRQALHEGGITHVFHFSHLLRHVFVHRWFVPCCVQGFSTNLQLLARAPWLRQSHVPQSVTSPGTFLHRSDGLPPLRVVSTTADPSCRTKDTQVCTQVHHDVKLRRTCLGSKHEFPSHPRGSK